MTKKNQHVVPHPDGWAVKSEGSQKAASVHQTQREAIEAGRYTAFKRATLDRLRSGDEGTEPITPQA